MLTAIFLHGHLGEKYGHKLMLDVSCVAEAVNLLKANFPRFVHDVVGHAYRVWVGKTNIDQEELLNPANGQDIHIVPLVAGAGGIKKSNAAGFLIGPHMFPADSGIGQAVRVIVGVVLVIVGFIFSAFGGLYWGVGVGIGLIIGGVSDYITFSSLRKLSPSVVDPGESRPSRYFRGAVNTVGQGNPVPVLYGRMRVGSQVISGGLSDGDV